MHTSLSHKLNDKKYEYATLAECFDTTNDLTNQDNKIRKKAPKQDCGRKTEQKKENCNTPPHLPSSRNDRKGRRDKPTLPKPRQYTDLNMTINNILYSIKDKPFLKQLKPFPEHLVAQREYFIANKQDIKELSI